MFIIMIANSFEQLADQCCNIASQYCNITRKRTFGLALNPNAGNFLGHFVIYVRSVYTIQIQFNLERHATFEYPRWRITNVSAFFCPSIFQKLSMLSKSRNYKERNVQSKKRKAICR